MRQLLKELRLRLTQGQPLALVSITASSGATPRGAGARMLVGSEGRICGTIGGGAVEYRAIQLAREVLHQRRSGSHDFSLTRDDVQNLGMICGGAVQIFIRYLAPNDEAVIALADRAESIFAAGQDLWLLEDLQEGGGLSLYTKEDGFFGKAWPNSVVSALARHPQHLHLEGMELCTDQICFSGRVYLFGAGHVARELEPVLTHVGFRCVVLDDRGEFLRPEFFPTAEEIQRIDFARISDSVSISSEDYVCIMTRGHAYDTVIQSQVLPLHPAYVGVIGSRKKAAAVRQTLREDYGLSEADLDQVVTPIGLPIQAETPEEIAISIAAQMIAVRAAKLRK